MWGGDKNADATAILASNAIIIHSNRRLLRISHPRAQNSKQSSLPSNASLAAEI